MSASKGRSSIACNRCRKLKVKCTGCDPCDGCRKKNLSCTYSCSRINNYNPESFERLLADRKSTRAPEINEYQDTQTSSEARNDESFPNKRLKAKMSFAKPFDVVPSYGHSWLDASYTHGWVRYQNLLLLSLCEKNWRELPEECRNKIRTPRPQFYGWNMSGVHYLKRKKFPRKPDADFSEKHQSLIEFFFKEINPLVGILNSQFLDYVWSGSVFSELDSSSSASESDSEQDSKRRASTEENLANDIRAAPKQAESRRHVSFKVKAAKDEERISDKKHFVYALLYLVYAISLRFMEFDRNEGPRKEMLVLEELCFRFSYEVIDILSFETLSLELIQAWTLIAFYLRTTQRRISLLVALDRANCMAANSGLHLDSMNDLFKDKRKNNNAKHIFWSLYTFDRLFSLQIGRSSFWTNNKITVSFPESYNKFATDRCFLILSFAMLKLAIVVDDVEKVRNSLVTEVEETEVRRKVDELELWLTESGICKELLYDSIRDPRLRPLLSVQVLLQFSDIKLCLHGPMLFNYIRKGVSNFCLDFQSIISCSREIVEYVEFLKSENLLKQPWYMTLLSLFTAGTCTLSIISSGIFMSEAIHLFSRITSLISSMCSFGSLKPERFKMAEECLSALLRGREIILLRLRQCASQLESSTMELRSISGHLKDNAVNTMAEKNSNGAFNYSSEEILQFSDNYSTYSDELGGLSPGNLTDNLDILEEPLLGITDFFNF